MDKEDKEDLLKYFNEWNGITPGAYEGLLKIGRAHVLEKTEDTRRKASK